MALDVYWARNDGMSGHVWLDGEQVAALIDEMVAQGMAWHDGKPGPGIPLHRLRPGKGLVPAADVEDAVAIAEVQPRTGVDQRLWLDWLRFLEGAATNGGLLAR